MGGLRHTASTPKQHSGRHYKWRWNCYRTGLRGSIPHLFAREATPPRARRAGLGDRRRRAHRRPRHRISADA